MELTPPEALLIGHHIAQQFSEAEKDLLLAHVARIIEIIKAMGPSRERRPAPGDSLSAVAQPDLLGLSGQAAGVPGHARTGPGALRGELRTGSLAGSQYYAHRHEIAVSVSAGLREGCKAAGLQSGTLNLTRALNDFFTQENAVERWINGEEVFGG